MSGGVFICYRREETAFAARAIYDRVAQKVGRKNVFLDVDNIDPGVDWFDALNEQVGACDALIAAADKDNRRRIDDPDDFVRIEIEAALKRGVRVIPVLVDGALMPKASDLPESLRGFARRQNIEISHTRFEADAERLTRTLASILGPPHPRQVDETEGALPGDRKSAGSDKVEPAHTSQETDETRRYRVAADRGDANGQVKLGWLYENGLGGVPKDERVAARLYKLAADQGSALGQAHLGVLYEQGRGGLPTDDREAARLYKLAAGKGNAQGQVNLGWLYEQGRGGLPKDEREAARFYKLAADRGDANGQVNLGWLYEQGRGGLPKNDREAARFYKLAADQGSAGGQANLGRFYEKGRGGLTKDEREAARLYKLAADRGNASGQARLGEFYEYGRGGLQENFREAKRLYRLAAAQGNDWAQDALIRLLPN
jgi:TPR repeat protein